jgi:NADH-quinone oxidoreductase subunit G
VGPGGAALAQPGLSAREMWGAAVEGRLRGMYIAGLDPAGDSPAVAAALDALEFLVVQDLFMTETAQRADVVLPAAVFAEREGTFTNAERRVQRFRQARQAPEALPADWQIFQDVVRMVREIVPETPAAAVPSKQRARARAGAAGTPAVAAPPATWDYLVSADIAEEIGTVVPAYAGATYTSLARTNGAWGRQLREAIYYDGTSYENTEGVGIQLPARADDGKIPLTMSFQEPALPAEDSRHPFVLLMPARLYGGGEWLRGSKIQPRVPAAHVILSMADAQRLQVGLGEKVRVSSAAGALELPAQIDAGLAEGLVLIPAVRGVQPAAILTGPLTRVAVSKVEQ